MAFVVAAVTIAVCVFAAAFTVARTEQTTVESIEARAPQVKRWTAWIVITVGLWFLVLATFADRFADVFPV